MKFNYIAALFLGLLAIFPFKVSPQVKLLGGRYTIPSINMSASCWEPGNHPGFDGIPKVEQVDVQTVQVSWFNITTRNDCADKFFVKYWESSNKTIIVYPQLTSYYTLTPQVPNDQFSILITVKPEVEYTFEVIAKNKYSFVQVARGGKEEEYYRSEQVDFKTDFINSLKCWKVGNFTKFVNGNIPKVEQVSMQTVKVSWSGITIQNECTDQFLVKYWESTRSSYLDFQLTSPLKNNQFSTIIRVAPKVKYIFQVITNGDMYQISTRSRVVEFGTASPSKKPKSLTTKFGVIPGKIQKGQYHYQLPDGIEVFWNNVFEDRNPHGGYGRSFWPSYYSQRREIPWTWCDGHSIISSDNIFDFSMEISQKDFDKNITLAPKTVNWLKNNVWSGFADSKIKFAMGLIRGYYGTNGSFCEEMRRTGSKRQLDWRTPYWRFWNDNENNRWTGVNGEVAQADQYAVFYRNGTWPDSVIIGPKRDCDWYSQIPQGFSCGVAAPPNYGCTNGFVPVDCSEVVLKVVNPRSCKNCRSVKIVGMSGSICDEPPYGGDCVDRVEFS